MTLTNVKYKELAQVELKYTNTLKVSDQNATKKCFV